MEKANDDVTNLLKMLEDVGHDMDRQIKRADKETRELQTALDALRNEKSLQDDLVIVQKGLFFWLFLTCYPLIRLLVVGYLLTDVDHH